MADPKIEKRVLLPIYYPNRAQFKKNGNPSGAVDAVARCQVSLESMPHWVMGLRLENIYQFGTNVQVADMAALATSRQDELQEVRCTIGTYQIFDWTAQSLITGAKAELWHPFPMRMSIAGNVNVIVEARRLTSYPFDIIPELAMTLVTVRAQTGRPGDVWLLDVDANTP